MTDQQDRSVVDRLAPLWLAWFCIYLATCAVAMMRDRTGLFAQTVDHVAWPWFQFAVLNIPLQLILAAAALMLAKSTIGAVRGFGNAVAVITTGIMAAHIVTSIAVWLAQ